MAAVLMMYFAAGLVVSDRIDAMRWQRYRQHLHPWEFLDVIAGWPLWVALRAIGYHYEEMP